MYKIEAEFFFIRFKSHKNFYDGFQVLILNFFTHFKIDDTICRWVLVDRNALTSLTLNSKKEQIIEWEKEL